jgi:hypothetical protein
MFPTTCSVVTCEGFLFPQDRFPLNRCIFGPHRRRKRIEEENDRFPLNSPKIDSPLIDVYSDPTGEERGSRRKTVE